MSGQEAPPVVFTAQPPIGGEKDVDLPPLFTPDYAAVLDYILRVEVPARYQAEFDRFKPVLTQALALANINRKDILYYRYYLKEIRAWYRIGQGETARELMMEMVATLMLTRSVDGFQQKVLNTVRKEQSLEGFGMPSGKGEKEKKSFWAFRR